MNRRQFTKLWGVAAIALTSGWSLALEGCGNVWSEITRWEPLVVQAFTELISILQAAGVLGANTTLVGLVATANADFGDLNSAVNDAVTAAGGVTAGAIAKVVSVMQALQGHLTQLEMDAHLTNTNDQQAIQLGFQSIITTLAAFEAELTPVAQGKAKISAVKLPNANVFRAQFNAIMDTHGHADKRI